MPEPEQAPCPVCASGHGFHAPAAHQAHQVPPELTWKPGEAPPWEDEIVEPPHVKEDTAAVLSVLKGLSEENL
jgi:hypothetical protein